MQTLLNEILEEVRPLIGKGKVADYIPALADVPANQLGIAVYGNDGSYHCAGDARVPFSVQSISKVFSLVQAIGHSGKPFGSGWGMSLRVSRSTRWYSWSSSAGGRVTRSSMQGHW